MIRDTRFTQSSRIASFASQALLAEVALAAKPGLVSPHTRGAHHDMDHRLFISSAVTLKLCFEACARAGENAKKRVVFGSSRDTSMKALFHELREIGQDGERSMYRVTGGINTHKGAIFCLGLLSAAVGYLFSVRNETLGDAACDFVAELCAGIVEKDLDHSGRSNPGSAGEKLYQLHGIRGARGQAQDGYPLLKQRLLPVLRIGYPMGPRAFRHACMDALLISMGNLEDTCLLSRGGFSGLDVARQGAALALNEGGSRTRAGRRQIRDLDERMCAQGLSPGGSADMLAAGIFLVCLEQDAEAMRVLNERELAS